MISDQILCRNASRLSMVFQTSLDDVEANQTAENFYDVSLHSLLQRLVTDCTHGK